jgi:ABC-type antimicrobial peptide transport system permease subunit
MGITAGLLVLALTLITGTISGIYPALLLSSFRPVTILKESIRSGKGSFNLRKVLVVFQFVISVGLIICTIVVSRQLDFLQNKELGLQKDNILYFSLNNNTSPNIDAMKNELKKSPDVLGVSYTSHLPIQVYSNGGGWEWEGKDSSQDELVTSLFTDKDFLKTFGVKLEKGRFFSDEYPSDTTNAIVINKTFADMISNGPVAGKILTRSEQNYNIVGVVQNFDFLGSRREAGPIAIRLSTEPRYASIKLNGQNTNAAVDYITKVYKEFDPNYPFEYHFLDSTFEEMFKSERRLGDIFNLFALLAIIISCLGLFGLSAYIAEQKTKEIGIRKVLGATVFNVVINLTKEFLKWVLIANIVAWPLAYYFMTDWLKDYPYKISLGWDIFIISGFAALLIAIITISFQSVKAALSDPAKSLRYE